ncbi:hypothetical protein [Thalassospira australica]|uniref:hypothetical protein n=1 Tax=Thalassospira australica TaxID=1528106 RepID=UPI000AFA277D|nr:hypothetical protein [Thalassospira australica]
MSRPVALDGHFPAFLANQVQTQRVCVVKKPVLLVFTLIGLGVAAYFLLPLTPVPDYINAVIDRAGRLF